MKKKYVEGVHETIQNIQAGRPQKMNHKICGGRRKIKICGRLTIVFLLPLPPDLKWNSP